MDALLGLDRELFSLINGAWTFGAGDAFFPFITGLQKNWIAMGLLLPLALGFWIWRARMRAVKKIIALALALSASDFVCYRVIKPFVDRPRPEAAGLSPRLLVPSQGGPAFPSNHAANIFAAATILWLLFRRWSWAAFVYAAAVAYSRVYVGVHRPLDVLGGAAIGAACAFGAWYLLRSWIESNRWRWEPFGASVGHGS